jgi:hypothetical protein
MVSANVRETPGKILVWKSKSELAAPIGVDSGFTNACNARAV